MPIRGKASQMVLQPFPFLSLPRELRDEVYRYHLLRRKEDRDQFRGWGLDSAVLRVNKQIHKESSTILHDENPWVLIQRPCLLGFDCESYEGGRISYDAVKAFHNGFAVYIVLGAGRPHHYFLSSPSQARMIYLYPGHVQDDVIHVHFGAVSHHEDVKKRLLLQLQDMRGVSELIVGGCISMEARSELVSMLRSPPHSMPELIARAEAYVRQGDEEVVSGQYVKAERSYLCGWDFPLEHLGRDCPGFVESNSRRTLPKMPKGHLRNLRVHLYIEFVGCMVQNGAAREGFSLLKYTRSCFRKALMRDTKTNYYLGLSILYLQGQGKVRNRALKAARYFKVVLSRKPDHKGALWELRGMEERLDGMGSKDKKLAKFLRCRCSHLTQNTPKGDGLGRDWSEYLVPGLMDLSI